LQHRPSPEFLVAWRDPCCAKSTKSNRHPLRTGWTTIDFGSIQLALHILPADNDGPIPYAGLNLEVDRIEEMQESIARSGGRMKKLIEPRDGVPVRVALFEDSEGNGFELRQKPEGFTGSSTSKLQ
jgi:hypothetical protein